MMTTTFSKDVFLVKFILITLILYVIPLTGAKCTFNQVVFQILAEVGGTTERASSPTTRNG